LIPQDLSIEAKTNYYLIENLECREVVAARDSSIADLKMMSRGYERALKISRSEKNICLRLNNSYLDSIHALNISLDNSVKSNKKQIRKKVFWRSVGVFSLAFHLLFFIGVTTL
jgi:hypothetical protein